MSRDLPAIQTVARTELPEMPLEVFSWIGKILKERTGFCLELYKEKCILRRIDIRIRKTQCSSAEEYAALLASDQREPDHLLRVLTIHVSQFFRNRGTFDKIASQMLPQLLARAAQRGNKRLNIWSVGCAAGEEPYSLAILLRRDFLAELGKTDISILATDVDAQSIESAGAGIFRQERLAELSPEEKDRWFTRHGRHYKLAQDVMDMVTFRQGDMADISAYPASDLILCRNVLIYLDRSHQEKILAGFAHALGDGGILVLGKAETLVGAARNLFQTICPVERIYQAVPVPAVTDKSPLAPIQPDHLLPE